MRTYYFSNSGVYGYNGKIQTVLANSLSSAKQKISNKIQHTLKGANTYLYEKNPCCNEKQVNPICYRDYKGWHTI